MAYNFGDPMRDAAGNFIGNYMGGAVPAEAAGVYGGWGGGTPQATTSLGVPLQNNGMNSQLDQPSAIALQMEAEQKARDAQRIAQLQQQNPGQYNSNGQLLQPAGLGTAAFGQGAVQTVAPAAQVAQPVPEVAKPMPVTGGLGGGTAYAGTSPTTPAGTGTGGVGFNPSLAAYQDDMARRQQQFLADALQGIQGSFVGAGGLGGGRQRVLEDRAIVNAADNLQGQFAGMNLQDWTNQQNRNLQNDAQRNSFYTSQRGQDLQALGLGAGLIGQGFGTDWGPINQANQIYGTYAGNGTTTQNSSSGGGWMGGLGGALGVAQLANQMGWWK